MNIFTISLRKYVRNSGNSSHGIFKEFILRLKIIIWGYVLDIFLYFTYYSKYYGVAASAFWTNWQRGQKRCEQF